MRAAAEIGLARLGLARSELPERVIARFIDRYRHPQQRSIIGRYLVLGELGRGGMGVVYEAWDPRIERCVAIKTLEPELVPDEDRDEVIERFRRETKVVGRLHHPGIVTIFDYGEELEADTGSRILYYVMEYLEGASLAREIRERRTLPDREAVAIGIDIADALQVAHDAGVIHRDIKPSNIFLRQDQQAVLLDFGIAKTAHVALTRQGQILGTPSYLAPERLREKEFGVDGRSDIFSLGVLLFTMLTGDAPFVGDDVYQVIDKIARESHPKLARSTPAGQLLSRILDRMLAKRPEERYDSAHEAAEALRGVLALLDRGRGSADLPEPPLPAAPLGALQEDAVPTHVGLAATPNALVGDDEDTGAGDVLAPPSPPQPSESVTRPDSVVRDPDESPQVLGMATEEPGGGGTDPWPPRDEATVDDRLHHMFSSDEATDAQVAAVHAHPADEHEGGTEDMPEPLALGLSAAPEATPRPPREDTLSSVPSLQPPPRAIRSPAQPLWTESSEPSAPWTPPPGPAPVPSRAPVPAVPPVAHRTPVPGPASGARPALDAANRARKPKIEASHADESEVVVKASALDAFGPEETPTQTAFKPPPPVGPVPSGPIPFSQTLNGEVRVRGTAPVRDPAEPTPRPIEADALVPRGAVPPPAQIPAPPRAGGRSDDTSGPVDEADGPPSAAVARKTFGARRGAAARSGPMSAQVRVLGGESLAADRRQIVRRRAVMLVMAMLAAVACGLLLGRMRQPGGADGRDALRPAVDPPRASPRARPEGGALASAETGRAVGDLLQDAQAALSEGKTADAERLFAAAARSAQGPEWAQATLGRADALRQLGKRDVAIGVYRSIIQEAAKTREADAARVALAEIGAPERAVAQRRGDMKEIPLSEPRDGAAPGATPAANAPAAAPARRLPEISADMSPDDKCLTLAAKYIRDPKEGVRALRKLSTDDAHATCAYKHLGVFLSRLGDNAAALEAYRTYLELEPRAPNRSAIEDRIKTLEGKLAVP